MARRSREIANRFLSEGKILSFLRQCTNQDSLQSQLGPLVEAQHKVTVSAVVRGSSLLSKLIDCGCTNGVTPYSKFELCVKNFLPQKSVKNMSVDDFACKAVGHIRFLFGTLRELYRHKKSPDENNRKKTHRVRKDMSAADRVVVYSLVDRMQLTEPDIQPSESAAVEDAPRKEACTANRGVLKEIYDCEDPMAIFRLGNKLIDLHDSGSTSASHCEEKTGPMKAFMDSLGDDGWPRLQPCASKSSIGSTTPYSELALISGTEDASEVEVEEKSGDMHDDTTISSEKNSDLMPPP